MHLQYNLIGILVLFLNILAIVHIWKASGEPLHKILWTLLVLLFPVVGFIIWFFVGPKATENLLDVIKK